MRKNCSTRDANMSLLALFFLLMTKASVVGASSGGQTPALRYTFLPGGCSEGIFGNEYSNSFLDGLIIANQSTTIECAPSLGVRMASSQVENGEDVLVGIFSEDTFDKVFTTEHGIAVELWWKPSLNLEPTTLLTIGADNGWNATTKPPGVTVCERESFDLQLVQVGSQLVAIFRTSDEWFEGCHMVRINVTPGELMHVVVSLSNHDQRIFVNGNETQFSSQEPFINDLSHWNGGKSRVYLFHYPATPQINTSSEMTIYRLALYDGVINSEGAELLMLRGLPSTPPFAYDQSVTVQEDADDGTHSVEWYALPALPTDATQLLNAPRIGWIDAEVRKLLSESIDWDANADDLGWIYWILKTELDPVYVYLTSLPEIGQLYHASDRSPLAADGQVEYGAPVLIPLGPAPVEEALIYLPPHNVFSKADNYLASFTFCLSTTPIFDAIQCSSKATVSIHVEPVNDPPVALPVNSSTIVTEGIIVDPSTKIQLQGRDVDFNDTITAVEITRPPAHGSLQLAVPTFRQDLLRHGTSLESLNHVVTGEDPVYVNYIWDPADVKEVIRGMLVKDYFRFRVRDRAGLWSAEETVEVQIATAVTGNAEAQVIVEEDTKGELEWRGIDSSGYNRQMGFFIEKLTSPSVGSLVDPDTLDLLQAGNIVDASEYHSTKESSARLLFLPSKDFCHSSNADEEEKNDVDIRFRAVAIVNDTVVSVSDSVSQLITVSCVLDVISLTLPLSKISVLETSLRRTATDPCYASNFTGETLVEDCPDACEAAVVLPTVTVTSKDRKADRARVTVTTKSGYLSFNSAFWNRTDSIEGRQRMAAGAVSFFAYPEDLTGILSSLRYQSYTAGTDSIDFEIRYGDCIDSDVGERPGSFRTASCQVVRQSIEVSVLRDNAKYESETRIVVGLPWQIFFCLLAYPALYLAVTYLQCSISGEDEETVVEGSPLAPNERFIQHEDEHGMFYYEDTWNGSVRWDLPTGEDFVRFEDFVGEE